MVTCKDRRFDLKITRTKKAAITGGFLRWWQRSSHHFDPMAQV